MSIEELIADAQDAAKHRASTLFAVTADNAEFAARIGLGLGVMGVDPEVARRIAESEAAKNPSMPLAHGIANVVEKLRKPRPIRPSKSAKAKAPIDPERFDARPADYRRAVARADANGVTVLEQLKELGMAPMLDEIFEF